MGDLENIEAHYLFDSPTDEENHSLVFSAQNHSLVDIPLNESGTTRIPPDLISHKPEAYKPRTISLGPLNFDDFQLRDYEEKKKQLLQDRFPYRVRHFKELVDSMINNLSRIRKWYPIPDSFQEDRKLGTMIALDGIFLLQFLRGISPISDHERSIILEEIQRSAGVEDIRKLEKNLTRKFREQSHALTNQGVQEDILKLQNQIPFFALNIIIQWEEATYQAVRQTMLHHQKEAKEKGKMPQQMKRKEKEKMLQDIIFQAQTGTNQNLDIILRRAWHNLSPFDVGEESLIWPGENAHILGFVYENILGKHTALTQRNGEGNQKKRLPATALALDKNGVKFAAYTGPLKRIRFDRNTWTLRLPRIEIAERTDTVMRNLLAFELFARDNQTKPMTCYVQLMDQLINTAEDVEVLIRCRIINNHLGSDQAVANIWNKMREGCDQNGEYGPIDTAIEELINCCSYRIWFSEGVKEFFSKPWRIVSFITGCIFVITAIVQTILSGLQLRHH